MKRSTPATPHNVHRSTPETSSNEEIAGSSPSTHVPNRAVPDCCTVELGALVDVAADAGDTGAVDIGGEMDDDGTLASCALRGGDALDDEPDASSPSVPHDATTTAPTNTREPQPRRARTIPASRVRPVLPT